MKENEKVLVVARKTIFQDGYWKGLKKENLEYYLNLIRNNSLFKPRVEVENDPSWQQIIPYILFNFQDKYFIYRYLKKAGEQRLKNDYLLGIGGHINPTDIKPAEDILWVGTMREWHEEVDYKGKLIKKKLIGVLNDDRRPVEAVHLGLVYLFVGDSPAISVKERDVLKGELVNLVDLRNCMKQTNGWAPIVYRDYLSNTPLDD